MLIADADTFHTTGFLSVSTAGCVLYTIYCTRTDMKKLNFFSTLPLVCLHISRTRMFQGASDRVEIFTFVIKVHSLPSNTFLEQNEIFICVSGKKKNTSHP